MNRRFRGNKKADIQVSRRDLLGCQPNDVLPRYGKEDPSAETGTEGVDKKLGARKDP